MSTENITDMAKESMDDHHMESTHSLEGLVDAPSLTNRAPKQDNDKQCNKTPPEKQSHYLAQVDVYMEYFISICQDVPKEMSQMLRHLFRSIVTFFCTNKAIDGLHKEPIYTKNLCQGDATWYTKKTVLGWDIDTKEHHLRLMPERDSKVRTALDKIPTAAHQVSLHKWGHLLGLLWIITPAVARSHSMFTCL